MTVYFLYPPKQPFFKSLSALLYYFVLWKFSKDRFFAFLSYPNDRCRFSFESGCKGKSFSLFPPNILVNIFWKSFSCSPRLSPSLAWKSDAKVLLYPIRSKYITTFFMLKNIPNHTTALPSNRWTGDFFSINWREKVESLNRGIVYRGNGEAWRREFVESDGEKM